ncbi:YiiX/YebB-like N1pC/P60 family cysteine hydrolase [Alkalihalobacillus trypoxylicola]|uniref:Uncharacterized protein n=1 Tax=Alkalihalobacillus trypoxylicola TaxID=519424 RepID=A0A162DMK8_9BACI|nr:YiiX/YebB-like N1pC/P60 family cysteine hydrolase [Alkalihalobacillus trypoxylicola]KYG30038.1 hypothetical protein AZF04_20045 [Alkalihalobacillus trypoxylicola]
MKFLKIPIIFFSLIIALFLFAGSSLAYDYPNGTKARTGDILVTNETSSKGLTGHVAIAINADQYIDTRGPGDTPTIRQLSDWFKRYTNTKVVRPNDQAAARSAGQYAATYHNSGIPYKVNFELLDNSYIYCSKLVWQAYAFTGNVLTTGIEMAMDGRINMYAPYNFLHKKNYANGGQAKLVYSKGMITIGDLPKK